MSCGRSSVRPAAARGIDSGHRPDVDERLHAAHRGIAGQHADVQCRDDSTAAYRARGGGLTDQVEMHRQIAFCQARQAEYARRLG